MKSDHDVSLLAQQLTPRMMIPFVYDLGLWAMQHTATTIGCVPRQGK